MAVLGSAGSLLAFQWQQCLIAHLRQECAKEAGIPPARGCSVPSSACEHALCWQVKLLEGIYYYHRLQPKPKVSTLLLLQVRLGGLRIFADQQLWMSTMSPAR